MRARSGTRPAGSLPPLHTLQLRPCVNLHNAIDLAIWMRMMLSRKLFPRIYIHSRYAKEPGFFLWQGDLGAPIMRAIDRDICRPAFVYSLPC
jgi:hypothetical protein